MSPEAVNRETLEIRRRLARLAERVVNGERGAIYPEARDIHDALCCLLDEAPESKLRAIGYLIDRTEALIRSISN